MVLDCFFFLGGWGGGEGVNTIKYSKRGKRDEYNLICAEETRPSSASSEMSFKVTKLPFRLDLPFYIFPFTLWVNVWRCLLGKHQTLDLPRNCFNRFKESLMCPLQFPSLASSSAYIDNKHIRLNFHTQEFNPSSHDQPFHLKVNTFAIVRTPGIVKGNNPLNLVWWGSQWLGILKDFPQSRCILISHWSREK